MIMTDLQETFRICNVDLSTDADVFQSGSKCRTDRQADISVSRLVQVGRLSVVLYKGDVVFNVVEL